MSPLADPLSDAVEAAALNQAQHLALFNPSPEIDSLAEKIAALHRTHDVPWCEIQSLLRDVRHVIELNASEGEAVLRIAGALDRIVTDAREASITRSLGIHGIARALRPHLKVLASPDGADARTLTAAHAAVREVMALATTKQLRSASLRHELRPTAHDTLLGLIERRVTA